MSFTSVKHTHRPKLERPSPRNLLYFLFPPNDESFFLPSCSSTCVDTFFHKNLMSATKAVEFSFAILFTCSRNIAKFFSPSESLVSVCTCVCVCVQPSTRVSPKSPLLPFISQIFFRLWNFTDNEFWQLNFAPWYVSHSNLSTSKNGIFTQLSWYDNRLRLIIWYFYKYYEVYRLRSIFFAQYRDRKKARYVKDY